MNINSLCIIKNPIAPELAKKIDVTIIKENFILNIGRLDRQKNQELLIKAFSSIKITDWKLLIVGEGNERKNYEELISSLHIQDRVLLIGKIDDVSDYYNRASVFAFSSRYEGFPNALMEAIYFGLPCVSTDCPSGPSELIVNNYNGFLVPNQNQILMEKALLKLMLNKDLREKFAINSKLHSKLFEHDVIIDQWKSAIDNQLLRSLPND